MKRSGVRADSRSSNWFTLQRDGVIGYGRSAIAWDQYDSFVRWVIEVTGATSVCEIGGGANPLLDQRFVEERNLEYVVMDVSEDELGKGPDWVLKRCADILDVRDLGENRYDVVFSKMLAEHVHDGKRFHSNVATLLKPGAVAVHYFPTLFAPPFVLNALIPDSMSARLLGVLQSGRANSGPRGKFRAFYSWCRGPTQRQITRLEKLGYTVDLYIGFFGHAAYYQRWSPIKRAHLWLAERLLRHPVKMLTSFAWVVLRKET